MNQLTQCTQVVSQQLTEANTVTQTANESVVHSKDLLEKAVNHSEQLSHDLEHSSVEMQALESTVTNITSSLSVIEDIASQINLLALNAAIEAARAGEQGRGFAVVADEVRTLAYRTQESTGSISDMLTELRTATDDAVQSMQRGKTRSEQASQDTNIANDALQQVVANISHLKEVNNAINLAAMEQLQISESLAQKVCAMSEESASATKHAKSSLLLSQDMQNDAVDLQKLVSRFTL
jgi:methyl-accepting chemotaxis protein